MANRNPLRTRHNSGLDQRNLRERGAVTLQLAVIMVGVLFGLMGFAIDLGRLYSGRAELTAAANAIALAQAAQLIGTEASLTSAAAAGQLTYENQSGSGNKYDFGGLSIGQDNGGLNSNVPTVVYFDTLAAAIGTDGATGGEAGGNTARHVKVQVHGETPLIFWGFLPAAAERKLNLIAQAVAGVSAPLCTACGIDPIAVAAISTDDSTDFGFTIGTRYTLGHFCNGGAAPGVLTNDTVRLNYVLLNRLNESAVLFPDEGSQLFRIGAQGLPASAITANSCLRVAADELAWVNTAPGGTCNTAVNTFVRSYVCGVANRFDQTVPTACAAVAEADTIAAISPIDTDLTDLDDYTQYTGNKRRIITIAIVDALSAAATMNVQGFRQFLLEPIANDVTTNAADANGRFSVMYLGSKMPLKQGSISGCTLTSGPGKVVLHQ